LFIAGEPWQVDLSAQVFSTLLPSRERARVTEAAGTISLYYEFGDGAPIAATMLVLSGRDLRAIEQTIQVGRGEDRREYRLAEDRIAFLSGDAVPPGMFEPELAAPDRRASPVTALRPAPRPPSPERLFGLEIEALRLLDAAGALLGEQVTVIRTQDQVRIRAMVDSDGRKRELERAIEPLAGDSRVVIDVQTFAAVAERQPDSGSSIRFREVDVPGGDIPVGPQLRRFFGSAAGQAATPETQEQVRAFARRVVEHSRLTVQHAWAIKRLQARYSPHEAAALPADARSTWRRMIGDHARNVAERGEIIRALLHPVFMVGGEAPTEAPRLERSPPSDVRQIAEQLLDLVHTQDQAVRTAFSASSDPGRGDTFIATRQFFERLDELVNLARRLA
jgi:hypothetical protein